MHYRFFRDSFWGRVAYHLSGHRLFRHQEEMPDYVIPQRYLSHEYLPRAKKEEDTTKTEEVSALSSLLAGPQIGEPGDIIVDWDGEDDPENPLNWPLHHKAVFIVCVALLTMSVYMGSAIYTPGVDQIMEEFLVGPVVATLPLTLFVIGYGIGPMIFSPMSENAIFGRALIYIVTLFIFFILQIPTALVNNLAGLCILRFIAGFFASPSLSTGGASVADVLDRPYRPLGLATWAMGAVAGPSLGPLLGAAFIEVGGWRWTFWFMAIMSGSAFVILGFMMPETYDKTLLTRKAKRLRKLTGNDRIKSEGEIENANLSGRELAIDTLWRPMEITMIEPVVLLFNLYISLVYSIMYLWFEAFPMVFTGIHHFGLVPNGVSFVSVIVGIIIAAFFYVPVVYRISVKRKLAGIRVPPEAYMPLAIVGSIMMPIGVFLFGWTSAADIHWMVPMVGAAIFAAGSFLIFQTLFNALSANYRHEYLASVFALNCLFRSAIAGCFPLFARPLFMNLKNDRFPVAWGSTVLGGISVLMIAIPVAFYMFGAKLRARSKYADT